MELLIKGGTLVTAESIIKSDILIKDEKIIKIGENIETAEHNVIDASGKFVFPGFIDTHTHFDLEGACKTADNFYTGTKAAIIGGTTTILDFATQDRGMSSISALEKWHKKADNQSSCDYGFHMSFTEWNERLKEELALLVEEGITSFKVYMAYDNLLINDNTIEQILMEVKKIGGILGAHCEVGRLVDDGINRELKLNHFIPKYHPISRPPKVEAEAIKRYLSLAKKVNVPAYIVHLSSALGIEQIEKARVNGQKVYVETCPQYLILNDSCYEQGDTFEGAKYVLSPPLRKKFDNQELWKYLSDDKIDTIGTDHCSFNFKQDKELGVGDFSKIPNGIPGVEHRPVLLYNYGVNEGKISLNQMVKLLSTNAAKLFGLYPKKGELAVGSDADIVIWDPNYSWEISSTNQMQNVDYTPYEGMKVKGKVDTVLLRGVKVVENNHIILENRGKYLKRGKSIYL